MLAAIMADSAEGPACLERGPESFPMCLTNGATTAIFLCRMPTMRVATKHVLPFLRAELLS